MKITGAEWKLFEATGWPTGYIWAEESTLDNGRNLYAETSTDDQTVLSVRDDEIFIIPDWWEVCPDGPGDTLARNSQPVRSLVAAWRKANGTEIMVVMVPKGDIAEAKAFFSGRGWQLASE